MTKDWQIDRAIAGASPFGMGGEPTFSGVLSLFRRRRGGDRHPL